MVGKPTPSPTPRAILSLIERPEDPELPEPLEEVPPVFPAAGDEVCPIDNAPESVELVKALCKAVVDVPCPILPVDAVVVAGAKPFAQQ